MADEFNCNSCDRLTDTGYFYCEECHRMHKEQKRKDETQNQSSGLRPDHPESKVFNQIERS
jgi:hypothetical protein